MNKNIVVIVLVGLILCGCAKQILEIGDQVADKSTLIQKDLYEIISKNVNDANDIANSVNETLK